METEDILLLPIEVSEMLKVNRDTVKKWRQKGKFDGKFVKLNTRCFRFFKKDFKEMLTPKEVARMFRVTIDTIKKWRKKGRFDGKFISLGDNGSCIRFYKSDIEEMIIKY